MLYKKIAFLVISIVFNFSMIEPLTAGLTERIEQAAKVSYPLHDSVRKGDLAAVQSLLDKGYDIEQRLPGTSGDGREGLWYCIDGMTALEIALENKNSRMIQLLLNAGADPYNYKKDIRKYHDRDSSIERESVASKVLWRYGFANVELNNKGEIVPNKKDQKFFLDIIKQMKSIGITFDKITSSYEWEHGSEKGTNKCDPIGILNYFVDTYVNKGWKNNNEIKQSFEILETLIVN
jgi:hypothetical protein